jgi:hypothetical protein
MDGRTTLTLLPTAAPEHDSKEDERRAEWAAAVVAALAEMPTVPKTKTATVAPKDKPGLSYSYQYADLPSILEAVRPVLARHGLAVSQEVSTHDGYIQVTTLLIHKGGHREAYGPLAMPAGQHAQASGSAITYARRYALTAVLGIAAEDDDDGQAVSTAEPPRHRPSRSSALGSAVPPPHPAAESGAERCPSCGSDRILRLADGERRCRSCSQEWRPE